MTADQFAETVRLLGVEIVAMMRDLWGGRRG